MYKIRIVSRHNRLVLRKSKPSVRVLRKVQRAVNIQGKSKRGLRGEPGKGVPEGGNPGQLLVKSSTDDYDTMWSSITGSDKNYIYDFTNSLTLNISHNLAKYPAVTIQDSSGDEVIGSVTHNDINNLTLTFSAPFTGRVTCN